jgi:hypothetical protein
VDKRICVRLFCAQQLGQAGNAGASRVHMRGTSLIISRCPIPVQLEQKRPCEGLRGEHAFFDRCPCCATIRCGDDDYTIPQDIVARYGFAIDILNADFFTHCGDPFWGRFH